MPSRTENFSDDAPAVGRIGNDTAVGGVLSELADQYGKLSGGNIRDGTDFPVPDIRIAEVTSLSENFKLYAFLPLFRCNNLPVNLLSYQLQN